MTGGKPTVISRYRQGATEAFNRMCRKLGWTRAAGRAWLAGQMRSDSAIDVMTSTDCQYVTDICNIKTAS